MDSPDRSLLDYLDNRCARYFSPLFGIQLDSIRICPIRQIWIGRPGHLIESLPRIALYLIDQTATQRKYLDKH